MLDYVISGVNETQIMDVFEHHAKKEEPKQADEKPEYLQGETTTEETK